MIVLKILLYILLAVLGIILVVLIVPIGGELSYIDGKFRYNIRVWIFNFMDSDGGGFYRKWKKRKAEKKEKTPKPEKAKKFKPTKAKKKKQREQYEWEKELENITVNDPTAEADMKVSADETEVAVSSDTSENVSDNNFEATHSEQKKENFEDEEDDDDLFGDDDDDDDDDAGGRSIKEKLEFLVEVWESADRPTLKILQGIRIYDLYVDFVIADEDAYKCALKYGKYSILVYNIIAFFSEILTIKMKTVDVRPQFGASKERWDTSGKFTFKLGTLVIAGVWFLVVYLFRTYIPEKLRKRKMKKSAARQK